MISVIVCSNDRGKEEALRNSVSETIGVAFEFIAVENSDVDLSIFEAYNLGLERSNGDYLCFCHNDIEFKTQNWGKNIIAHFEAMPECDLLGVAGSEAYPKVPCSWWGSEIATRHVTIDHRTKDGALDRKRELDDGRSSHEVVFVDGVFMCFRRKVFDTMRFDEETFDGFHAYDLDISFQVFQSGRRVAAISDVLIEHASQGALNMQYVLSILKLHDKWSQTLPSSCWPMSADQTKLYEVESLFSFAYTMKDAGVGSWAIRRVIAKYLSACGLLLSNSCFLQLALWVVLGCRASSFVVGGLRSVVRLFIRGPEA